MKCNNLDKLNRKFELAEESVITLVDSFIEIIQAEEWKQKGMKKN